MSNRVTAADVRASLKRRFAAPECAIFYEVAQGTGAHANRHLDAVAMELWPSRGLALHGIEIKVNIYDWRREKANPEKAEEIARFCDFFWIAAPVGLIPVVELPSAWGLLEWADDGSMRVAKQAQRTDAQPINRHFLAAMLRAASRPIDKDTLDGLIKTRIEALEKDFANRVQRQAELIATRRSRNAEHWEELVSKLGYDPGGFWHNDDMARAVKVVLESGVANAYQSLRKLSSDLADAAAKIKAALGDLAVPQETQPTPRKRRRA